MSKTDPPGPAPGTPPATRERIRAVAEELYVLRGYDGLRFGDIAEAIGTTRANIHHHFGSKRRLMDELIDRFSADAQTRIEHHWRRQGVTFSQHLADQLEDLRRFYRRFNGAAGDRNVWSPVSRLRLDLAVLGAPAARALDRVNRVYDDCLRRALREAVESGELVEDAPVDDIARVLRVTLLSFPPITQDTGSFEEVERLFASLGRMIAGTWGNAGGDPEGNRGSKVEKRR